MELQQLTEELSIRDARKLHHAAVRREVRDADLSLPRQASKPGVARQVFAPKPRSLAKAAASQADQVLQADLIDFSKNARSSSGANYALLLADVYSRELEAKPLRTKHPEEVNRALREAIGKMAPESKRDYVLSTDRGGEFAQTESVLPESAVHREKEGINDLAVTDRGMQTIKRDLAGIVAKEGRPVG